MKNLFFLFASFTSIYAGATTKISVVDGNWSSPETWSPIGVPFAEDTVIINTDVFADEYVDVGINTFIINVGKSLSGNETFALHGNLFNYGTIDLATFAIGDGSITRNEGTMEGGHLATSNTVFENISMIYADTLTTSNNDFMQTGIIENLAVLTSGGFVNDNDIKTLRFGTSGSFTNNKDIECRSFLPSGEFTNNGAILTDSLISSANFINNSDIRTGLLFNTESISGSNGKFCVLDCFFNDGSITGELDICDESTSFCDINTGTIAGSVTFCEVSPCAMVSTEEIDPIVDFKIYPNPVSDYLAIELNQNMNQSSVSLSIYGIDGTLILEKRNIETSFYQVDVTGFPSGTYFTVIQANNSVHQKMFSVTH